jgi:hypothetical protein
MVVDERHIEALALRADVDPEPSHVAGGYPPTSGPAKSQSGAFQRQLAPRPR